MLVMLLTAASFMDELHTCGTRCLVHARAGHEDVSQ